MSPTFARAELTRREVDVAERLLTRASLSEIARDLGISPLHLRQRASLVYQKLGVRSRWELIALVIEAERLTARRRI